MAAHLLSPWRQRLGGRLTAAYFRGNLPSSRLFASSSSSAAKPGVLRKVIAVAGLGAVAVGIKKANEETTPPDAEAMAIKHEEDRQADMERIAKKLSKWRLVELFLLAIPVALTSPLWLIAPGLFWKIFAWQVDRSGPCFIKLAQWLSTRRDMFSDELCESLSIMHEKVEASWSEGVSHSYVMKKLTDAGLRVKQLDDVAVASGSIAEVFFGTLEDDSKVAVKCLRPGVRDLMEKDLAWLLFCGDLANQSPKWSLFGLRRAAEDFAEQINMQVDFNVEANHLTRFRNNFENSGELVRFPEPLYASKDLLVLTKEKGDNLATIFRSADGVSSARLQSKLSNVFLDPTSAAAALLKTEEHNHNVKARYVSEEEMNHLVVRADDVKDVLGVPVETMRQISKEVLCSYMRMIFKDAFVHGDLHPGNIMIRLNKGAFTATGGSERNQVGGWKQQVLDLLPGSLRSLIVDDEPPFELVLLDAGLAIPIAPKRVECLRAMGTSMLYCDFKGSATHIYNQSPNSSKCKDPNAFTEELADVFRRVRMNVKEAGYLQVSDACLECLRCVRQHHVELDTGLTWALFAMLSAEGCARQLDPEADCTGAAARYIVSVPSLMREMKHQSPRTLMKMVKEIVVGRQSGSKRQAEIANAS